MLNLGLLSVFNFILNELLSRIKKKDFNAILLIGLSQTEDIRL